MYLDSAAPCMAENPRDRRERKAVMFAMKMVSVGEC
jgi:hypothetical protein